VVIINSFIWPLVNLLLLIVIAGYYGKEPLQQFLSSYEEDVEESIDRAEQGKRQAQERLKQWRERVQNVDSEVDDIISRGKESRERLQREMKQKAQSEKEYIKRRVQNSAERERERTFQQTRKYMSKSLVEAVKSAMMSTVDRDDHRRLVNDFIKEVGDES